METEKSFSNTCINCGTKVNELYKMYSPTVLKLSTCDNCGEISDKYIEYDPVIIMIDLVLLQKEAYRHFLYNTEFKTHWKLAVLVQLMEAYSEWMFNMSKSNLKTIKNDTFTPEYFFNQSDLQFYIICLKIMFGTAVYNITVYLLTLYLEKVLHKPSGGINMHMILKTFTISSFGKFFLLPALIWTDHTGENLNILFVFIYTTLCQFLVYSVVCQFAMFWAISIIFLSHFMRIMSMDMFYTVFYNNI